MTHPARMSNVAGATPSRARANQPFAHRPCGPTALRRQKDRGFGASHDHRLHPS